MEGAANALVLPALGLFVAGVVYLLREKPAFRITLAGAVAGTAKVILAALNGGAFGLVDVLAGLAVFTGLIYLVGSVVARRRRLATKALFYPGAILFLVGIVMFLVLEDQMAMHQAREHLAHQDWTAAMKVVEKIGPDSKLFPMARELARQARTNHFLEQVTSAAPSLAAGDPAAWDVTLAALAGTDPGLYDRQAVVACILEVAAAQAAQGRHLVALEMYCSAQTLDPQVVLPQETVGRAMAEARTEITRLVAGDSARALETIARCRKIFTGSQEMASWLDQQEFAALAPQIAEIDQLLSTGQVNAARTRLLELAQAYPRQEQLKERATALEARQQRALQEIGNLRKAQKYDQALALVQNSADLDLAQKEQLERDITGEQQAYLAAKQKEEAMARNMARTLVQERLLAPGTARWVAEKILERDKYGRYLVHVVVDSQNAFGAFLRGNFLVVLRVDLEAGGVRYNPNFGVQQVGNPPTKTEIAMMKSLNNWDNPPE